jgi:hypothetical protein
MMLQRAYYMGSVGCHLNPLWSKICLFDLSSATTKYMFHATFSAPSSSFSYAYRRFYKAFLEVDRIFKVKRIVRILAFLPYFLHSPYRRWLMDADRKEKMRCSAITSWSGNGPSTSWTRYRVRHPFVHDGLLPSIINKRQSGSPHRISFCGSFHGQP